MNTATALKPFIVILENSDLVDQGCKRIKVEASDAMTAMWLAQKQANGGRETFSGWQAVGVA